MPKKGRLSNFEGERAFSYRFDSKGEEEGCFPAAEEKLGAKINTFGFPLTSGRERERKKTRKLRLSTYPARSERVSSLYSNGSNEIKIKIKKYHCSFFERIIDTVYVQNRGIILCGVFVLLPRKKYLGKLFTPNNFDN